MLRRHSLSRLIALLLAVSGLATATPIAIRCGHITEIDVLSREVEIVNLEKALTEKEIEPRAVVRSEFVEFRSPAEGHEYVVLEVSVAGGKSLGKADYGLRVSGRAFDCKALATDDSPFDPRRLAVVAESSPETVRMLFEIPAGSQKATLVFLLPVVVSIPDVVLTLREEPAPPAEPEDEGAANPKQPEPEDEGDEPEAVREPEPEPEPEPKPAPDPEPEPEPEPAPEPETNNDPWGDL